MNVSGLASFRPSPQQYALYICFDVYSHTGLDSNENVIPRWHYTFPHMYVLFEKKTKADYFLELEGNIIFWPIKKGEVKMSITSC